MTAYSSSDAPWARSAFFDLYPMASLFKIITASAALETKRITPDTVVEFRGRGHDDFSDEILRLFDWMGRFRRDFLRLAFFNIPNAVVSRVFLGRGFAHSLLQFFKERHGEFKM